MRLLLLPLFTALARQALLSTLVFFFLSSGRWLALAALIWVAFGLELCVVNHFDILLTLSFRVALDRFRVLRCASLCDDLAALIWVALDWFELSVVNPLRCS